MRTRPTGWWIGIVASSAVRGLRRLERRRATTRSRSCAARVAHDALQAEHRPRPGGRAGAGRSRSGTRRRRSGGRLSSTISLRTTRVSSRQARRTGGDLSRQDHRHGDAIVDLERMSLRKLRPPALMSHDSVRSNSACAVADCGAGDAPASAPGAPARARTGGSACRRSGSARRRSPRRCRRPRPRRGSEPRRDASHSGPRPSSTARRSRTSRGDSGMRQVAKRTVDPLVVDRRDRPLDAAGCRVPSDTPAAPACRRHSMW